MQFALTSLHRDRLWEKGHRVIARSAPVAARKKILKSSAFQQVLSAREDVTERLAADSLPAPHHFLEE
jgi:hypothetical protein